MDLYTIELRVREIEDRHVEVSLDMPEIRPSHGFTLAEIHRATTDVAGILARVHSVLPDQSRPLQCERCPAFWGQCTVSAGSLVRPADDLGDPPWISVVVPKRHRKAAIELLTDLLGQVTDADTATFTVAQERAWQEGAA